MATYDGKKALIVDDFPTAPIKIPRPASISGIALFKDELKLLTLPTESLNINEKVSIGFLSCISNIIEPMIMAIINPIKKE
jgi:hypothetical protein